MDILRIVLTLVLIAALIFALVKNMNAAVTLTALGLIGMFVGAIINKTSPLTGQQSSGILFVDIFKWFNDTGVFNSILTASRNIAVFAYVFYMEHIKASTLFALIAAKPISKIKNKNLLIFAAFALTIGLLLVISSGTGRIALLMGVLWPIMQVCGVSRATAACSIFLGSLLSWGPTNVLITVFNSYSGSSFNPTQYFLGVQWPFDIASTILVGIVFIVTSKYFDKKENAVSAQAEYKDIDPKALGIPGWYAILPIVPLFLVILFSGIVKSLPVMDIAQVEFMCFILVFAVLFLVTKNRNKATQDAFKMYEGSGIAVANIVSVIIGGTVFGKGISMLQGINAILNPFVEAGASSNIILFILVTGILGLLISAVAQTSFIPMAILGPVFLQVFSAAGANLNAIPLIAVTTWTLGMGLAPASPHIALTHTISGIPIKTLWKRVAVPVLTWALFYIVTACILL